MGLFHSCGKSELVVSGGDVELLPDELYESDFGINSPMPNRDIRAITPLGLKVPQTAAVYPRLVGFRDTIESYDASTLGTDSTEDSDATNELPARSSFKTPSSPCNNNNSAKTKSIMIIHRMPIRSYCRDSCEFSCAVSYHNRPIPGNLLDQIQASDSACSSPVFHIASLSPQGGRFSSLSDGMMSEDDYSITPPSWYDGRISAALPL